MLILAKITTSAAGGYADYLHGKAQASALGDYYLKDGERIEAPGRWAQGADTFGLDGDMPVTAEQLQALIDVRRPDTGTELRRAGGSGEAVAAIDATFSAPKSVSAAWALADPALRERIEQAHETAIDRALGYATRQVKMIRRRLDDQTVIHEKATGLIATSWRHTTARAVADQIPDPQLHSHVLLHGALRRDERVMAIDSRAWLVHQRELGAAYRTELARELHQLGFDIRRGTGRAGRYFEIDGIPQTLIDRWSSRHHQVQTAIRQRLSDRERELQALVDEGGSAAEAAEAELELLRHTGQLSPAQERLMGTITRSAKLPATTADLDREWRATARGHGIDHPPTGGQADRPVDRPALLPATPQQVLDELTEFDATFAAREARAVALETSAGAQISEALEQLRELRRNEEILLLADGTGTTRAHRGRERQLTALIQRLADARVQALPVRVAQREADRLDRDLHHKGGRLSDEQRTAITLACGDRPLVVIEGHAGTGKSTALTGIARAHQTCGQQIIVTSTAAIAAERLAGELTLNGVTCHAYSTTALHAAITSGRIELSPETTIIHDEAALASTREQHALLDAVNESGARLIAVGDPQQNPPVGAGGLWPHIERATRDAEAHVELTRNQRAHDPDDRRDQAHFRAGRAEEAIRGYHARGRVHLHGEVRVAEDHALDAAHADRSAGRSTIVIAQTSNEHLDALNARAQAIRYQAGQLGSDSLPLPGRPYQLHPGDDVQIRRTIQHPDHGPLRNGTTAHITTIDAQQQRLGLELADSTHLTLTAQQAAEADLRLAYVQHPFPAQGHTTDTTHLLILDHTTREGTYVGLTRARHTTDIHAPTPSSTRTESDPIRDLVEHASQTEPELPSIHTPLADAPSLRPTNARDHPSEPNQPTVAAITAGDREPRPTVEQDARPARDHRDSPARLDAPGDQEPHRVPAEIAPARDAGTEGIAIDDSSTARHWPQPRTRHHLSIQTHERDEDRTVRFEP